MELPRSLSKDKTDDKGLHSPKWREEQGPLVTRFHEHVPFFYRRGGSPLHLEGMYRGGHAFLIANGPSLTRIDMTPLKQRWCMTLNNGAKTFRGNANCTVDDPIRFSTSIWLDPTIMKFLPMAQFEKQLWDNRLLKKDDHWEQQWGLAELRVGDCPNIVGFRRNEKFHAPRWLYEETINWGNHTKYGGGRSVMLAAIRILYLLGFRHVYLLGADFEMSADKRYHFDEGRSDSAIRGNMSTYAKMQAWFTELQPSLLKAGFRVFNCNPASRLTAFPHLPYLEAIERSGGEMGDVWNERTTGMYQKPEAKKAAGIAARPENSRVSARPEHEPPAKRQFHTVHVSPSINGDHNHACLP